MECIIKSRTDLNLEGKPFTYRFYREGSEYIYVDVLNHRSQICLYITMTKEVSNEHTR